MRRIVMAVAPDLELTLPARAENVAVVRHAFGGFGDALDVPDQTLVGHQARGDRGVHQRRRPRLPRRRGPDGGPRVRRDGRLTVVVADEGRGMLPRPDSPGLGLGLPLIATLAESLELGTGADDETEVRMTFRPRRRARTAPGTRRDDRRQRGHRRPVRSGPLVGAVLGRVVGMLAARAQCPIDRLDDALLLTDAVAAHAPDHAPTAACSVVVRTDAERLEMRVGALARRRGARRSSRDAALPGVGNVLERVADEVEPRGDEGEELVIRLRSRSVPDVAAYEAADAGFAELTLEVRDREAHGALLRATCSASRCSRARTTASGSPRGEHARLGLWLPGEKEFGDEGGRHVHFAFSAAPGRLDDAGRAAASARASSTAGPVEHDGGDRSLYVEDPEGNVVEVWDFFERGEGAPRGRGRSGARRRRLRSSK